MGLKIVLDTVAELDEGGTHDETRRDAVPYAGDIALDHVGFRYPDAAEDVFTDLSLMIQQNRTTAFVGSSGAGKSTLLDLILGLQDPTSGAITCGGRSVVDDKASWYATLGVVPQDVFLTNDTVLANIAFGVDPGDVDEDRIREVVRACSVDRPRRRASEWPSNGGRRTRCPPVGWPEAAPRSRSCALPPPHGACPRRGDLSPRQRDRARDHRDAGDPQREPHDPHRRSSALDCARRRHPHLPQGRAHRG